MAKNLFYYLPILLQMLLHCSGARAQSNSVGLSIQVPSTLSFCTINRRLTVYYELAVSNPSADTIQINKLNVVDNKTAGVLFTCDQNNLGARCNGTGIMKNNKGVQLSPGGTVRIYIELVLPGKPINTIIHQLDCLIANGAGVKRWQQSGVTNCDYNNALVLGAPLKGGPWAAVYEPSWERGHRRVVYTVNNNAHIPGRYAIDFIRLDSNGLYAHGNEDSVRNWEGYSAPVYSVADGEVVAVRIDFTQSTTLSRHPAYAPDMATGNYIAVKIDEHRFVFYEHLQPGSIKVKLGQKIKKGEEIAAVGFTGQTTGPHLHLHVADTNAPLEAEGLPFVFDSFSLLGAYTDFGNFGKQPWIPNQDSSGIHRKKERPSPNAIIQFETKP